MLSSGYSSKEDMIYPTQGIYIKMEKIDLLTINHIKLKLNRERNNIGKPKRKVNQC